MSILNMNMKVRGHILCKNNVLLKFYLTLGYYVFWRIFTFKVEAYF